MINKIRQEITDSIAVKELILKNEQILNAIHRTAGACVRSIEKGGKILICGNGGSAADAQHIAAELTGRFRKNRRAIHAEALHVNTSELTAIANDFGFESIFDRLVEAKGREGDILIAISTSGNSRNVHAALTRARAQNMICIGLVGANPSGMRDLCDEIIAIPSSDTARIQESHILVGHILCELIEETMFPEV